MATADYVGKTIDLWAFQQLKGGSGLLEQSMLLPVPGYICTGIEKLIQRWVIEFFTKQGSMPFQPNRGSTFMTAFSQGELQIEADLIAEFGFAADQIFNNIVAATSENAPPEEILQTAVLNEISILADQLRLTVTITSAAGTARQVILPIPFSVINTSEG